MSSFNAIDLLLAAAIVTLVTVVGVLQLWVLLLGLLLLVLSLLLSLSPNVRPTDRFVLTLVAVVGLIVAGCELFYVRDYFDETAFYRMNTVFKFYFQAWILLGVAGAYGGYRMVCHLRSIDRWAATLAMGVLSIGLVFGGVYTVLGPISYYGALDGDGISFGLHSLSGLESLQSQDPADFRAVSWIISSVSGSPRILEATGPDYSLFGRVSTYTGLPTILGWQGHEIQWRGADPLLNARHALVDAIYSTADIPRARRLLAANHITLVYVGPCERQVYGRGSRGVGICGETQPVSAPNTALTKFAKFMRTIYDRDGVQIYEAS